MQTIFVGSQGASNFTWVNGWRFPVGRPPAHGAADNSSTLS